MKNLLIILLIIITPVIGFSQTKNDSIQIKKIFFGLTIYKQNNKILTIRKLKQNIKTDKVAYDEYKKGIINYRIASILGFTSGFFIGWEFSKYQERGKVNWLNLGAAAGLSISAIPFNKKWRYHTKKAINIWNNSNPNTSSKNQSNLNLHLFPTNFALTYSF
jgi:hypothetical protein